MVDVSTGDRIWYAALNLLAKQDSITSSDVIEAKDDSPPRQTVYRRLEAMCEVGERGVLSKEQGRGSAPSIYSETKGTRFSNEGFSVAELILGTGRPVRRRRGA